MMKKMNGTGKIISLSLCAVMLFTLLFSVAFIAAEADHDCSGAGCSICLEIKACVNTLRFQSAAVAAAGILICELFARRGLCRALFTRFSSDTPVDLKVKFSD